jgi:hypothetical protein
VFYWLLFYQNTKIEKGKRMLSALKSNISKLICVDKVKASHILFYVLGFSTLVVSLSGCKPAWSAPAPNLTPEVGGAPYLFEFGASFDLSGLCTIRPFRRVYKQGTQYGFRFDIVGHGTFDESENTVVNFVNAIDAYKDKKIANDAVLKNSWVAVQGENGIFEFSLLDKHFEYRGVAKDVDEVAKILHLAINAMDEMKQLPPTIQP